MYIKRCRGKYSCHKEKRKGAGNVCKWSWERVGCESVEGRIQEEVTLCWAPVTGVANLFLKLESQGMSLWELESEGHNASAAVSIWRPRTLSLCLLGVAWRDASPSSVPSAHICSPCVLSVLEGHWCYWIRGPPALVWAHLNEWQSRRLFPNKVPLWSDCYQIQSDLIRCRKLFPELL